MQDYSDLIRWVREAKAGNEEAFALIYDKTCQTVYNIACVSLGDVEEAKDIVSEVFIRVFLNLEKLRDDQSFIRWLTVITRHVCMDHQKEEDPAAGAEPLFLEDGCREDTIEEWHRHQAMQSTVQKLLGQLPEAQQRVVQYVYFRQLSVGQAAALENCSSGTIKSRLYYARETLRKAIAEEERRSGDKLRLPVAVVALSAVMMLPRMPFALSADEAAQIFSTVVGVLHAQFTLGRDTPSVIRIRDEEEDTPSRGKRIFAALQQKYLLRFTPAAAIAAAVSVIAAALCIGMVSTRAVPAGKLPGMTGAAAAYAETAEGTHASESTAQTPAVGSTVRFTTVHGAEIIGKVAEDGTVCVTEVVCAVANLDIPARIDGLPVTEIADGAFYGNAAVEYLYISDTLERVSGKAIAALTNLEAIRVPESSEFFCSPGEILFTEDMSTLVAYPNAKTASSFSVPAAVKTIGAYAMNSRNLTTLTFGRDTSVERMEEYCIAGCIKLTELRLPTTLTDIQPHALESPSVTCFKAAAGEENLFSWGGAVLSYDKSEYIRYPDAAERAGYTLPDPIISIRGYAFYGAEHLRKIIIPAAVTKIDVNAFAGCVNLEDIYFQGSCPAIIGDEWLHLDTKACRIAHKIEDESWEAWDALLP